MTAEENREARTPRRKRPDKSQEVPEEDRVSRRTKLKYDAVPTAKSSLCGEQKGPYKALLQTAEPIRPMNRNQYHTYAENSDVKRFSYTPGRSIAAAFYPFVSHNVNDNYFCLHLDLRLPSPHIVKIPFPFTICSSSSGLLLCQDHKTKSFHVFNPFIHLHSEAPPRHAKHALPSRNYRKIPAPNIHAKSGESFAAVLSVDLRNDAAKFQLLCALYRHSS